MGSTSLTVEHFELQIMIAGTLAAGSLTPNTDAPTAVERFRLFLNEVKKHDNLYEIPPPGTIAVPNKKGTFTDR
jgi:hypothetical protein